MCGRVIAIDPWKDQIPCHIDSRSVPEEFMARCGSYPHLERIVGYSPWALSKVNKPRHVDLCYIDGNHEYDAVLADIVGCRQFLRKGNFIAGHDYGSGVEKAVKKVFDRPDKVYRDSSWVVKL